MSSRKALFNCLFQKISSLSLGKMAFGASTRLGRNFMAMAMAFFPEDIDSFIQY